MTIGAVDDPQYSLSRVEGIASSPGGDVYVLQHEDANVRQFDSAGVFVRTIGTRGMGPGEFSLPTKLTWSNGVLSVVDGNLLRVTDIDDNGAVRETRSLSALGVQLQLQGVEELKDHSQIALEHVIPGHPVFGRDSTPLVHVHDGRADTIVWMNVRRVAINLGSQKHLISARHPFADNDVVRVGPSRDTFIVARRALNRNKALIRLFWFNPQGKRVRERSFDFPVVPIPDLVRDSVVDHFAATLTKAGISPNTERARDLVRSTLGDSKHYPAFRDLIVGTDGSVWLSRGATGDSEVWLHLNRTGEIVGSVAIPSGIRLLHIRPPYAWGTQTTSLGVPTVVRLLIQ